MKLPKAAKMVLGAVILIVATANAQELPLVLTTGLLSGTNGDSGFPRAHVGETVDVQVGVWNFCEFDDCFRVNSVSLVIHHGSGDVTIPNLLSRPTVLAKWGDSAVVTTNFVVQPDDPDILLVDYMVTGSFRSDDLASSVSGVDPMSFFIQWGCQIVILKSGPPTVKITLAGPDAVSVSWSIASEGCQLESSDDLGRNWIAVADKPVVRNGEFTVTLSTAASGNQFFRLAKP